MKKMDHFLEHFFHPGSVAVVGATNNTFKMNFRILQNLMDLDFKGRIYPVNPAAKEISGIRAFARLRDIPDKVDLVVSAVPASKTMDIVKDCADIGVKHLVKEYGKPFALWCAAMDRQEMELVEMLEARSLPVFRSSERAVKAFSAMYRYGQRIGKEQK